MGAACLGDGPLEFKFSESLRSQGFTGYLGYRIPLKKGQPSLFSVATRKYGGFSKEDEKYLEDVCVALRPVLALDQSRNIAKNICRTYIGPSTGDRVLEGSIKRGTVESLRAVVWYCDARSFTDLSLQLDMYELTELLNDFFGAIAGAIDAHDGEVLKFIGDAALAIFPIRSEDTVSQACANAIAAARMARERVTEVNERRLAASKVAIRFGVGITVGDVSYGNIGAPNRLDFTVIGAAVNLASRLEGLCSSLGQSVLLGDSFYRLYATGLDHLGDYLVKGIPELQPVYYLE